VQERADRLLAIADDELVLGWRDSEWTGIAPYLEEDVAFSSIAQNEVGHARALYELAAGDLGTTADELAFDRSPSEYRCVPLVEQRLADWADTIARHYLYELADELRIARLRESDDDEVAGLAAKIEREETYHRIHAQMWADRLAGEPRFVAAVERLWPAAVALLEESLRPQLAERAGRDLPSTTVLVGLERGAHTDELAELWDEMTAVRRSVPGAAW